MKRIITSLVAAVLIALPLCAQTKASVRIGAYGIGEAAVGDYSAYVAARAGGGLSAEFGLPFAGNAFGVGLDAEGGALFAKDERVAGGWNVASFALVWYSLPLGNSGFSFQPEAGCGVWLRGISVSEGIQPLSYTMYTDFAVRIMPSFRFSPAKFNAIEFELSPVYTLVPVSGGVEQFIGGRLGVRWQLSGDKVQVTSEEQAK